MSIKVGVQIRATADIYEQVKFARSLGFDNTQLLVWDLSLYTDEFAAEVNRACRDFDFKITDRKSVV